MRRMWAMLAVVAGVELAAPGVARAELLRFDFAGTVGFITGTLLDGQVQTGDPYSGSFWIDSTTPDSNLADPTTGRYVSDTAVMTIHLGSLTWEGHGLACQVVVVDRQIGGDALSLELHDLALGGLQLGYLGAAVLGGSNVFASDALPAPPLSLAAFSGGSMDLIVTSASDPSNRTKIVDATMTLFTLVPEPSSLALLLVAGAAGAAKRARNRSRLPCTALCVERYT